jgi:hypothetical protein
MADHDRGQLLFGDLRQGLLAGALDVEVVLLAVEHAIRAGKDEPLVEQAVEFGGVRGELCGL